ncbi:MAG: hypothetical protein ACI9QD_000982 [Thermoproteota archaeon]
MSTGECSQNRCQFKVTVMNGDLILDETWLINSDSFEIIEGSQDMKGLHSTYSEIFNLR